MVKIKRQAITSIHEDMEKLKCSYIAGEIISIKLKKTQSVERMEGERCECC